MQIKFNLIFILVFAVIISCSNSSVEKEMLSDKEFISGKDTCDDPDADINCSFLNMPENISNVSVIAANDEPGERLIISGKVYRKDGATPFKNVILYFYHTNNKGIYEKTGNEKGVRNWQGKLHGWCKINSDGQYEIQTIRPASYPGTKAPAHIHCVVKLPNGSEPYYINDFVFTDDPNVADEYYSIEKRRGGPSGIVKLSKENGVWRGERNIVTGE